MFANQMLRAMAALVALACATPSAALADHWIRPAEAGAISPDGRVVVRDGRIVAETHGATNVVRPEHDPAIAGRIERFFTEHMTVRLPHFRVSEAEIEGCGGRIEVRQAPRRSGAA